MRSNPDAPSPGRLTVSKFVLSFVVTVYVLWLVLLPIEVCARGDRLRSASLLRGLRQAREASFRPSQNAGFGRIGATCAEAPGRLRSSYFVSVCLYFVGFIVY